MKKFGIFMVVAVAVGMASCTAQAPKADLKSDLDSLSYTLGLSQTSGLKPYLVNRLGVDTTYMADFVSGLKDGAKSGESEKKNAYYAGIQIGQQVNQMIKNINSDLFGNDSTKTINVNNFMAGFIAGTLEKGTLMTMNEAQAYAQANIDVYKEKALEERFAENKAAGEKFLAENKAKDSIQVTASGLQYKVLVQGTGAVPADSSVVQVNYTGRLIDGTKFDSNADRKDKDGKVQPAEFPVKAVIKGWTEALTLMPVGSKWMLYIPQELAYGSREAGVIKPFSALVFEVELVGIKGKK